MKTISIHDAKTNLSKYIDAAKKGERVYIGGFGKPEVVLVKISEQENGALNQRKFSIAKGKIKTQADAFSESVEKSIASSMLGE